MRRTTLRAKSRIRKTAKRANNVRNLKNKAWALLSQIIRRKAADESGNATCVTCGDVKPWRQLQAGHYVAKAKGTSVYFEERNIHVQCLACNVFKNGNLDQYALFMVKTYGPQILEELDALRRTTRQIKAAEYLEMIAQYTEILSKMEKLPEAA